MAIGDSLLNGMRSYLIDEVRLAQSIPALIDVEAPFHSHVTALFSLQA